FQSFGSSPERYTVIQWNNLRYLAGSGGSPQLKFQVILHENGEIKMQYHTVATGQSGSVVPHNNGASATIAIQNEAANTGLSYLREIVQNNTYIGVEPAGNLLHDNLAILFYSGEDTQAPIITHKPVGNTFSQTAALKATIIDLSPLVSKSLHFNSGSGWQSIIPSSVEGNDYYFELSGLPLGATIQYYFSATDAEDNTAFLPEGGAANSLSFKILPTADTHVLIAYSGTQDYQRIELPIYEGLLTQMNVPYDIYNWEEYDQYAFPDQYKGILVYANTGGQGEKAQTLANAIMNYLDTGTITSPKNLWFASDGWAANTHALPNNHPLNKLMVGYFRTHYTATGVGGGTNGLAGPNSLNYEHGTILCLPDSPVGTPQQEYTVYANSPDCIFPQDDATDTYWDQVQYPEIGSNYVFAFEDGPVGGQAYLYHGVCATTLELPIYRTMYFSFDFSQLTSTADRYEWMHDLMDWFGLLPVSVEQNHSPQIQAGFDKVFPNPFKTSTSIRYNVAGKEPLSIAVYNLKGQKVKQLVSDTKTSGNHLIEWDGTDSKGEKVASGIYHLRMETGVSRWTKRITLIK
ncbi:MAG TPA: T9SS type A sorting domain-containing protein, partial [Candidatus Cloacimonadota bacterium]|nr:T9SS type A sorting domain-containing protein [Candidatus Cloacimonadota bacterium]